MAGAGRFLRGAADDVLSRATGFGLMDDVVEEGAERFFTKTARGHALHAAAAPAANAASGLNVSPFVSRANASAGRDIMTAPRSGLLAAPMVKDSGMISSPRSETLFDLTMGARDVERRLEGNPASLLFPSGLVDYLETVNRREEKPNAMTRGMALLDVLPF
jgi:hypothetical protein